MPILKIKITDWKYHPSLFVLTMTTVNTVIHCAWTKRVSVTQVTCYSLSSLSVCCCHTRFPICVQLMLGLLCR